MAKVTKTTENKQDFISFIASMSDTEINDYIKTHGKPPKKVTMIEIIDDNSTKTFKEWKNSLAR